MRVPKHLLTLAVGILTGGIVMVGTTVAVEAGASGSNTTYYACLSAGKLLHVGTVAPTCTGTATQVSWGAVGPRGAQGIQGIQGATGPQGPAGATPNVCTSPPGPNLNFNACSLTGLNWTGVDLSNTTLISANLTGSSLYATNLSNAKLAYATLNNVASAGITGTPASLPARWTLFDGYLIGPMANLSSADVVGLNDQGGDFEGVNLSNASLTDSQLSFADFNGANFTNADLSGDTMSGAVVTNAIWSNTTCPDGTFSSSYSPQTCVGHGA